MRSGNLSTMRSGNLITFQETEEFTFTTERADGSLSKHVHKPVGPPVNTGQSGTIAEFSLANSCGRLVGP